MQTKSGVVCGVQNPVLTSVWAVCLSQILLPVVSFSADTAQFCQKWSIVEGSLASIYGLFAFLCAFLGASWFDVTNLYKFYHFPFSFSYRFDLIGWCFMVMFMIFLPVTRRVWDHYEHRQVRVVPINV